MNMNMIFRIVFRTKRTSVFQIWSLYIWYLFLGTIPKIHTQHRIVRADKEDKRGEES
jgi:hypothetical protein